MDENTTTAIENLVIEALSYYQDDKYEETKNLLLHAIKIIEDNKQTQIYFYYVAASILGEILFHYKEYEQADQWLRKAFEWGLQNKIYQKRDADNHNIIRISKRLISIQLRNEDLRGKLIQGHHQIVRDEGDAVRIYLDTLRKPIQVAIELWPRQSIDDKSELISAIGVYAGLLYLDKAYQEMVTQLGPLVDDGGEFDENTFGAGSDEFLFVKNVKEMFTTAYYHCHRRDREKIFLKLPHLKLLDDLKNEVEENKKLASEYDWPGFIIKFFPWDQWP